MTIVVDIWLIYAILVRVPCAWPRFPCNSSHSYPKCAKSRLFVFKSLRTLYHYCAFCFPVNSNKINSLRTLSQKHPGWGCQNRRCGEASSSRTSIAGRTSASASVPHPLSGAVGYFSAKTVMLGSPCGKSPGRAALVLTLPAFSPFRFQTAPLHRHLCRNRLGLGVSSFGWYKMPAACGAAKFEPSQPPRNDK
jgi:hypothetical protein